MNGIRQEFLSAERIVGADRAIDGSNPPWSLDSLFWDDGEEYRLYAPGVTFDPREPADREQMVHLAQALLDAVRQVAGPIAQYAEPTDAELDAARLAGPHALGCPALGEDVDGIDHCECEPDEETRS